MKFTLVGAPFPPKRGAPTLEQTNLTSSGLQQAELEPVLLQALVELEPQQVSPPLWLLVSVPPLLCIQSQMRQY